MRNYSSFPCCGRSTSAMMLVRSLALLHFLSAVLTQAPARGVTYVGVDLYTLQAPALLPSFSALDAFGGQVGGRAATLLTDNFHAILWSGPTGASVDLTPTGAATARISGLVSGQQVGSFSPEVTLGAVGPHAAIWSGTRTSLIDLNPNSELTTSMALATDGSHQVGYVAVAPSAGASRIPQAALWSGSAASVINLHPAGYTQSQANAVRDGHEAGQAASGTGNHAILWTGTAASAVDLNPAGAGSSSALGVGDGQQVGLANFPGFTPQTPFSPKRSMFARVCRSATFKWAVSIMPICGPALLLRQRIFSCFCPKTWKTLGHYRSMRRAISLASPAMLQATRMPLSGRQSPSHRRWRCCAPD